MMSQEKKLRKEIRNGLVAVLYSPGFGAGWSTWNSLSDGAESMIFDPSIVYMVEQMNEAETKEDKQPWLDNIEEYCKKTYSECYTGGADDLTIAWLPEGTLFKITEYDGNESIEYKENDHWLEA
jgi:hypothetical protein